MKIMKLTPTEEEHSQLTYTNTDANKNMSLKPFITKLSNIQEITSIYEIDKFIKQQNQFLIPIIDMHMFLMQTIDNIEYNFASKKTIKQKIMSCSMTIQDNCNKLYKQRLNYTDENYDLTNMNNLIFVTIPNKRQSNYINKYLKEHHLKELTDDIFSKLTKQNPSLLAYDCFAIANHVTDYAINAYELTDNKNYTLNPIIGIAIMHSIWGFYMYFNNNVLSDFIFFYGAKILHLYFKKHQSGVSKVDNHVAIPEDAVDFNEFIKQRA